MKKVKWRKCRVPKAGTLTWQTRQKRLKQFVEIANDVARECKMGVDVDSESVSFYPLAGDPADTTPALGILVSPSDGDLVPDGIPSDDGGYDGDYCNEAPWKATVLAALMKRLDLSTTTAHDFEFARKVYAGEMVHPSVAESIR